MYKGVKIPINVFLTSTMYGSVWPNSCSGHLPPWEEVLVSIGEEDG
jgi:hypothetical protein